METIKIYTEERLGGELLEKLFNSLGLKGSYEIHIVKSQWNSSFVDCIIELYQNNTLVKGFLVEITQSTEGDSRNSSAYQRLQKFIIASFYYPDYRKVLFHSNGYSAKTNTAKIGLCISNLLGINIIGVDSDYPKSLEELQVLKNKMKGPSHNTKLDFWYDNCSLTISAKLVKGDFFAHDPNIGFVSSLISVFSDKVDNIIIENHGLQKRHLESRNKLYKNLFILNKKVKFRFDNELLEWDTDDITIPENYFKILIDGEKFSMINLNELLEERNNEILFRNISGCEREKLCLNGKKITIPKKIPVPDLVFRNSQGDIIIIEGECKYNVKKGLEQLKTFNYFITLIKENLNGNCENIICGVVTDYHCDINDNKYFGYYLNSKNYQLNGFIY
jgi:hypothetical protein